MSDKCHWAETKEGQWDCCCTTFEFNAEGPEENGFQFCPYCGKRIKEFKWGEDDD